MIETVLLVSLGFLAASLIALVIAPAFHARAVRLTTKRIRDSLPLSEAEMRADKDLMRAEYAVKVHQLERQIEEAKLSAHRQFIEINRRDATLKKLKDESELLQADLEENQNARRVLEQTINDRLPKLEGRLGEARSLLRARDQELADLMQEGERQAIAFNEARGINAQLQSEVERLQTYLSDMQFRDRRRGGDASSEAEMALRSELEMLRAKARDQAGVIDRLQTALAVKAPARVNGQVAGAPVALGEADGDVAMLRGRIAEQAAEIRQLSQGGSGSAGPVASARLRELEELARGQADEIAGLKAEVEAARAAPGQGGAAVRESKSFLKGRLDRAEGELERERKTIVRLRAELAAANERAARQAAQFMEEMRRMTARSFAGQRGQTGRPAPAQGGPPKRSRTPLALRPQVEAEPDAGVTARTAGEPTSRARELQRTLEASFAGPEAASPGQPEQQPVSSTPPASAEGEQRSRLLDRLRTYEDA